MIAIELAEIGRVDCRGDVIEKDSNRLECKDCRHGETPVFRRADNWVEMNLYVYK